METSATRVIFLALLLLFGFRKTMSEKIANQSCAEFLLVIAAAELSVVAVVQPDKPLIPLLVPLLILIFAFRSRFLLYRFTANWSTRDHLIQYHNDTEKKSEIAGAPAVQHRPNNAPPRMGLSLIENGKVRGDNLKQIGKTQLWLRQELRKFGYRNIRQVNYLTMDSLGNFYMDLNKYIGKN